MAFFISRTLFQDMCIFLFLCMSETQTAVKMGYWCFSVWEDFLVLMSRSGELFFFLHLQVILDWIRSWAIPFMLCAQCTHVIIIRLCTHLPWWTDVWRDWLLSRTLAVLFSVKHPWHLSSLAFSVLQVHLEPLCGGVTLLWSYRSQSSCRAVVLKLFLA